MADNFKKNSRVKKPIYVSREEKARNQAIIDEYKNRFPAKRYKANIVYVNDKTGIQYVETGRYIDENECRNYAKTLLNQFNKLSAKKWKILEIIGSVDQPDTAEIEEKDKNTDNES